MLTLLLLAQLALHKSPEPKWTETPVPHWSCLAGWTAEQGNGVVCRKVPPFEARMGGYSAESQEEIHFSYSETVAENGKVRISYPPDFVRQPGCDVTDKSDAANVVSFSDESKSGITINAKPGHKLYLSCRGIIEREKEPQ